ncbi:hypothetical protein [Asanoa iriomotensis]|nr:hypothetical protein [Asanoa iriomotensis]
MKLQPTHIEFTSEADGRSYAALKPGTTWTQAKATAALFGPTGKPVRRK